MLRNLRSLICSLALFAVLGIAAPQSTRALDMVWDGGDGLWDEPNWNGGSTAIEVLGPKDGSNGWEGPFSGEEMENIYISGPGSIVTYDADGLGSDFRIKQGGTLTISDGAVWQQVSTDDWAENRWTEFEASMLTIDGGSFRRVGAVNDEGGGAMIIGSWRGDDNFNQPESLDYFRSEISITNGGRFENEGQLWIGGWGDGPAGRWYEFFPEPSQGFTAIIEINDGVMDLTGGDVVIDEAREEYFADGDLIFTNRWSYPDNPYSDDGTYLQPEFAINFTGPGQLIVDRAGIVNANIDINGEWVNLDPVTYQDLWDAGILRANGVSGVDGANFDSYFSVQGTLGQDNYTLTYNASSVAGDFNNDGVLTAADIDLLSAEIRGATNPPDFDLNSDGSVNDADHAMWVNDLRGTYYGDANLDGEFNSGDFVEVFTAGQYEDGIAGNSTWASGDWNGDGDFDSGDFVTAFQAGGYELGPRAAVAAVPEPASLTLLALAGLGLLGFRRR